MTTPYLGTPNFSREFVIECDASGRGNGEVLMQSGRSLAYFSKVLAGKSLAKSIYEKDFMALVLAIHLWRPYLLGR